jgi:uncharacterized protein YjbI with pentapeptide repeats
VFPPAKPQRSGFPGGLGFDDYPKRDDGGQRPRRPSLVTGHFFSNLVHDEIKVETMEEFEPPKYLASLIAAVNDGAKSAQGGAVLFLAVGLYLLATAFSASDEDLLLGKTVTISQIGASLPASFSFAIAPLVFVFLHIYALVRYDLLAANVRHFVQELRKMTPESDRERCRQLLANVEFIVALTAPRGSALYSQFWPWLFRGIVAVFPVAVLLLVQINALRYQSDLIVNVQRATLALDLAVLVWFFRRNALDGSAWPKRRPARVRRWAGLLVAPVVVMTVNRVYLSTVPADADAKLVRYSPAYPVDLLTYAAGNPLDLISCPWVNWGCRFLRVDHRTLIDKTWDEKALGVLRMNISELMTTEKEKANAERAKAMAAIEGVFLRDSSLRFAVLDESRLYAANLMGADLQSATLQEADISRARLRGAHLRKACLSGANLSGANLDHATLDHAGLNGANLSDASLSEANLNSATLELANLIGATLVVANLDGADLFRADLSGAILFKADLSGADLGGANLSDANLNGTHLSGADLRCAGLNGAKLINADLGGANLSDANLSGANLSDVLSLTQTQLDRACGKPRALPQGLKLDKECPAIARPPSISGKSTACGFRSSVAHPTFTPP